MSVLKLYGAIILVTGSFLFGLFSILLWLYDGFGYFSKTPTVIAAVIAVVLLAIHMVTGNMLFDILAERFIPSLMYGIVGSSCRFIIYCADAYIDYFCKRNLSDRDIVAISGILCGRDGIADIINGSGNSCHDCLCYHCICIGSSEGK